MARSEVQAILVEEIVKLVNREVAESQETIQNQFKKLQGCLILVAPLLISLLWLGRCVIK